MDNVPNTPEFNPQGEDCGAYTNHYCPALVKIKQAEREKYVPVALTLLSQAKEDLEYTLYWTENLPQCPLRLPAQMNLQRVKFQIDMLKLKAQKR
jgi:hypothetical protein